MSTGLPANRVAGFLRACLKTIPKRRVRARGLQDTTESPSFCRPGPLTGRVFKQALRKILVVSLWLSSPSLLSSAQEKAPVIPQDPLGVELRGKVVCLAEEMSALHEVNISATHEHLYGFKTTNGVYYTLLRNKNSEALFSDAAVRSKNLVIKGRVFPKSQLLEVTSLRSIRNGRLHEIYYYCQVCEINSVSPGICECCRQPTERVEKPLEEKGVTPKAKR